MKFIAMIEYRKDSEQIKAAGLQHHNYLRTLLDNGELFAAGPFANEAGALWIYEAETLDQVEAKIQDDPYNVAGVFLTWRIQPLAYWSAKSHKGK